MDLSRTVCIFNMAPPSLYSHIRTIYTIRLKYGLKGPFKTTFFKNGTMGLVYNSVQVTRPWIN